MALELFAKNQCGVDGDVIAERIRDFTALMPQRGITPLVFTTVQHSKTQGLINFDFSKDIIIALLEGEDTMGLRVIPALDKNGNLTVVITPYDASGDEKFEENKLKADCCPQPPPPFNRSSKLYHTIYDSASIQAPLIS